PASPRPCRRMLLQRHLPPWGGGRALHPSRSRAVQRRCRAYDSPVSERSPAVEDYLETIYELEESGIPAMRARLVERLGVSAPTVSETVARLEREGYL